MPAPPTGTILLVDDEDGVRVALRRLLVAQGHTVLEASHGAEAIAVVRMRRGNLDLVLSDVVMPKLNGKELADRVRSRFPGLPVLFMTGYAPQDVLKRGLVVAGASFIQKPFTPETLTEAVARMLNAGERASAPS